MSFSDLLVLFDVFVTIFVGFYITHWYSVRDTRTRALKDHYISVLSDVGSKVDTLFRDILDGKTNSKAISYWYTVEEAFITNFDDGVRLALPIKKARLQDVIFTVQAEITDLDFLNDHYSDDKLCLDDQTKELVIKGKKKVDAIVNEYLIQINNIPAYGIWHTIYNNLKFDTRYYRGTKKSKCPILRAILSFVWANIWNIIFIIIFTCIFIYLILPFVLNPTIFHTTNFTCRVT